ncbi:MAG: citrate lyase subunit alpha [Clostridiaceae bacterium]|jgi:citrate lyase subunit alpha/citrate CoA-transferase|nr:citrate lyase subunit alpha [Clostridiaceae bacterium]
MKRDNKVMPSLAEAIRQTGLRDGMTVSFHHHLRDGDAVLNLVLAECEKLGVRDLTVNASALMACHHPIVDFIRKGTVTGIECNYMHPVVGHEISKGLLAREVIFRSHGGRPAALERKEAHIDVAFIAASTSDRAGNCNGRDGRTAFGSIGYAMPDAEHADNVVVVTDHLAPYPVSVASIDERYVDAVVVIDSIGDPDKIMSGTTRVTRDPIGLLIADYTARALSASGLLEDGLSFQTGAGGTSLAVASFIGEIMRGRGIRGSFASGGITGMLVDLFQEGLFETLIDVQCFDRDAVRSIRDNEKHREISASTYASPAVKSSVVDHLDIVILGATEIDSQFNVNVHTDSNGFIMGGSGGHSDTAAGAKLSVIVAPLIRARLPLIVDRVGTISTPGKDVDLLVTQYGLACNPEKTELDYRLRSAGLPVFTIEELHERAVGITGVPGRHPSQGRPVARVVSRDGDLLDIIRAVNR